MFELGAGAAAVGRAPAYAYFFTRRQPYAPGITFVDHDPATAGAYHTGEVPYFLRTRESLNLFRRTRDWEPVDDALEADMSALLAAFARDGQARLAARALVAGLRCAPAAHADAG